MGGRYGYSKQDPFGITLHENRLQELLNLPKFNNPNFKKRVFVDSMGDLFHMAVPMEWIEMVFFAAYQNENNNYLFLTKRPENMVRWVKHFFSKVPENFWFGISAENQHQFDMRVPHLIELEGMGNPVLFASLEPLLGPIDFTPPHARGSNYNTSEWVHNLSWIVAGGESGAGARPFHPQWIRSIRDQCINRTDMGRPWPMPFYFKQWGAWMPAGKWFPDRVTKPNGKNVIRIDLNGRDLSNLPALWCEADQVMIRTGAKKAGCVLDGREWKDFPK